MKQLGIFAKYWQPGKVKTRLAASVGPELAAEFHRQSLLVLLRHLGDIEAKRTLYVWPPEDLAKFEIPQTDGWEVRAQCEGDLGEKMGGYFQEAFSGGVSSAVLIGADNPLISSALIQKAFQILESADVALGPCADGGYYLVGCRREIPEMWEGIEWSTAGVFRQTVCRLKSVEASWQALSEMFDVDDIHGLKLLLDELRLRNRLPFKELQSACESCIEAAP